MLHTKKINFLCPSTVLGHAIARRRLAHARATLLGKRLDKLLGDVFQAPNACLDAVHLKVGRQVNVVRDLDVVHQARTN